MVKKHKVFGIGLNKTGTSSLRRALVSLGYTHCDIRGRMTYKFFQGNIPQVLDMTEEYDSFEDWPWPLMYREVFERYGDTARYVLTTRRSPEIWVESLKAHSLHTSVDKNPRKRVFGHSYPHGVEADHIAFYENHNAQVRQFFADNNAAHLLADLCWETGDGWAELCGFLNEPVQATNFPHANKRDDEPADAKRCNENLALINAQLQSLKS